MLQVFVDSLTDVDNIDTETLNRRIVNLCKSIDRFWKNLHRNKSIFKRKYSDWLKEFEYIDLNKSK